MEQMVSWVTSHRDLVIGCVAALVAIGFLSLGCLDLRKVHHAKIVFNTRARPFVRQFFLEQVKLSEESTNFLMKQPVRWLCEGIVFVLLGGLIAAGACYILIFNP